MPSLCSMFLNQENNSLVTNQVLIFLFPILCVCGHCNVLLFDLMFLCLRDLSNNQIQSLHEDAFKGVAIETM